MKRIAMILTAAVSFGVVLDAAAQSFRQRPTNRRMSPGQIRAQQTSGVIVLPYQTNDDQGRQWMVYQGGNLQQTSPQQIYNQAGLLLINGNIPQQQSNQGRIDEKTGELLLENIPTPMGLTLTRRFAFQKKNGFVRVIDVLTNPTAQPVTANVQIQTNLSYGVTASRTINDSKRQDQTFAWVAQTPASVAVVEVFAGKNARQTPTFNFQQGGGTIQATLDLVVPPGRESAIMHLHALAPTQEVGVAMANELKASKLLSDVPSALRKSIVNFAAGGQDYIGDLEILRGDVLDVVELRTGDQIKGTLKDAAYTLQTAYGEVRLPIETVVSLVNVGDYRPRQLVVTVDGQIFGGRLSKDTIELQLSSGQTTRVPLAQLTRVGCRRRPNEPEEWTFNRPLVLMRTGERVLVQMPAGPVEFITRYGRLSLKPEIVSGVELQSDAHGVHEILLTDGSRFAGLLTAEAFAMKLDGGEQAMTFPAGAVSRLQLAGPAPEPAEDAATLELVNRDLLVGELVGEMKMDTAFDTITLKAGEIKSLARPSDNALDVQATLWDGTTLSGQLQQPDVECRLRSGLTLRVPVALIDTYTQPQPRPAVRTADRIKDLLADLNTDDLRARRERAEAELLSAGPAAVEALKTLRESQSPEERARIDELLKKLEERRKAEATTPPPIPSIEK